MSHRLQLILNTFGSFLPRYEPCSIPFRLTSDLVLGSGDHVVEDVEGPLGLGLSDAARLLQQVWRRRSQGDTKETQEL